MNIEEIEAVKMMKFYQEQYRKEIKDRLESGEQEGYETYIDILKEHICNIQLVLNVIERQKEELDKKDKIIDKMAKFMNMRSWKEHQLKGRI